jgi:hypothetical protein
MYPLILSFETINKLKLFFECGILMPQDTGTPFNTANVLPTQGQLELTYRIYNLNYCV